MPYVDQLSRERLADPLNVAKTAGELNYLVTLRIVEEICDAGRGKLGDQNACTEDAFEAGKSYALFNEIVVGMDDVKLLLLEGATIEDGGFVHDILDLSWRFIFGTDNLSVTSVMSVASADTRETAERIATARGAIECAKLEFYRRVVVPYEEGKCTNPANGDVYPS